MTTRTLTPPLAVALLVALLAVASLGALCVEPLASPHCDREVAKQPGRPLPLAVVPEAAAVLIAAAPSAPAVQAAAPPAERDRKRTFSLLI